MPTAKQIEEIGVKISDPGSKMPEIYHGYRLYIVYDGIGFDGQEHPFAFYCKDKKDWDEAMYRYEDWGHVKGFYLVAEEDLEGL